MTTSITIDEFGLSIHVDDPEALAVLRQAVQNFAGYQGAQIQDLHEGGLDAYGNDAVDMIAEHERRQEIASTILAGINAATIN